MVTVKGQPLLSWDLRSFGRTVGHGQKVYLAQFTTVASASIGMVRMFGLLKTPIDALTEYLDVHFEGSFLQSSTGEKR